MKILSLIFWWGGLPLQAALLWLMVRQRAFKAFPWFFTYTVFSLLAYFVRLAANGHSDLQFQAYWATDAIYAGLGIVVMYEVFRAVFRGLIRLWWFRMIYPLTVGFTISLAVVFTRSMRAGPYRYSILRWILAGELGVRVIQVSTFVILVILALLFGLRTRQHAFGVSAGFGIYSTVALLAFTEYYEIGTRFFLPWSQISVTAYNVAVIVWLWYFRRPPDESRTDPPPISVHELERYREAMKKVRRP
jgi:hypothetical protein